MTTTNFTVNYLRVCLKCDPKGSSVRFFWGRNSFPPLINIHNSRLWLFFILFIFIVANLAGNHVLDRCKWLEIPKSLKDQIEYNFEIQKDQMNWKAIPRSLKDLLMKIADFRRIRTRYKSNTSILQTCLENRIQKSSIRQFISTKVTSR